MRFCVVQLLDHHNALRVTSRRLALTAAIVEAKEALKSNDGVVVLLCNPLTLKQEQSGRVSLIPSRTPPLECHDKESQTQ